MSDILRRRSTPAYRHPDSCCTFMGTRMINDKRIYVCFCIHAKTVLLRVGDEPIDYTSYDWMFSTRIIMEWRDRLPTVR